MLDRDLARLCHTETRVIIQKVKRNKERFPILIKWVLEELLMCLQNKG